MVKNPSGLDKAGGGGNRLHEELAAEAEPTKGFR